MSDFKISPIAFFRTQKKEPYQAARQATVDASDEIAVIEFLPGQNFEQALEDIQGISHFWLIYGFHKNESWKPKVLPPRGSDKKVGVFSTRSPYRPNGLGLSCVEFVRQEGLKLFVKHFDLLDETPIFDIKPYLPYADSFPEAKIGWLENIESEKMSVSFSDLARKQIDFLKEHGVAEIENFILQQLQFDPTNNRKKRVTQISESHFVLAYRTWRIEFSIDTNSVKIISLFSGYSDSDLQSADDPYSDKALHKKFRSLN